MARIGRVTQKVFAENSAPNEIAKFGSLAAGSPVFTTDPGLIQSLSQYLGGWFDAVIGLNAPAIEDMNALFYLITYQLAYILQAGMPEWDAGTTYYIGQFASFDGDIFVSVSDNNLNNATTDLNNWKSLTQNVLTARFVLEDAIVPYVNISGPYFVTQEQSLEQVVISMVNSGTSGSTMIQLNQYRAGVLLDTATASLDANSGNPNEAVVSLSDALNLLRGDIVTCDIVSIALGSPESIAIEWFGGSGAGAGGIEGSSTNPAPYVYTVTALDITNKGFTLGYTPADPARVMINVYGGAQQFPELDYTVGDPYADDFLSWASLGLETIIEEGDKLLITYV